MTVYFRHDKWYIDIFVNQTRFRKKLNVNTKREALLLEAEYRKRLELGQAGLLSKNVSFQQLVREYLEYKKNNFSAKTYIRDRASFNNFSSKISVKSALDVTDKAIDQYVSKRKADDVSPRTINLEITCVKAMLNWAVKRAYIERSPIEGYQKLRGSTQKELKFLSIEEVNALLSRLSPTLFPPILTYLKTGLRKNELVYLKWKDIDFSNHLITVQAEDRKNSHHSKTYERRHVPIDDELIGVLKELKSKSAYTKPDDLVFVTKDGMPRTNNILREIKRQAKSVGIPYITVHMLRHTYASHLRMAGADLGAVGKLLGHKDSKTTQIYEHLSPEFLKKTAGLLPIKLPTKSNDN